MKAARFTAPGAPLEITSLARPRPGPGEALVRVRAVGLCGSDVHITEGHTPTAFTPITLGHEIAGVVEAVGDGAAQQVAAGDHVFVNPMVGCLACRFCRAGEVNFCSRRKILGIQLDGGPSGVRRRARGEPHRHAGARRVPRNGAHRIRRHGQPRRSGPASRSGRCGRGHRRRRPRHAGSAPRGRPRRPGRLGRHRSGRTSALPGRRCARRPRSSLTRRGRSGPRRGATAGRLDGVVDCVGIGTTFTMALRILRINGCCAVVGIGTDPLRLTAPAHYVRRALRVSGIYGYTAADVSEVAARLVDGSLDLSASISAVVPLDEVNAGIRMFADRQNSPVRVVVEP